MSWQVDEVAISVIIPTYNPNLTRLSQTLIGLRLQSMPLPYWELIIVDNNSNNNFLENIDLSWHSNSHVISEPNQGLTYARLAGFNAAKGKYIIMVDDDNVLNPDYLTKVWEAFEQDPKLGAIGGKSIGSFEQSYDEQFIEKIGTLLAVRNLGPNPIYYTPQKDLTTYPDCAPIGAGMGIRKALLGLYVEETMFSTTRILDRTGKNLSSGGDNEIIIYIIKQGYSVAYLPELVLQHLIPDNRLTTHYLAKLNQDSSKSWIILLHKHGLCPWPPIPKWTLLPRKIKSWFKHKAWRGKKHYIDWRGNCGLFDGLAQIPNLS